VGREQRGGQFLLGGGDFVLEVLEDCQLPDAFENYRRVRGSGETKVRLHGELRVRVARQAMAFLADDTRHCPAACVYHHGGMRRCSLLLAMVALTAWLRGAEMRPSTREVREAVTAVVQAQLAALRRDDVAEAYRHASAPLRAQTPLPAFVRMLQQSYREDFAQRGARLSPWCETTVNGRRSRSASAVPPGRRHSITCWPEKSEWRIAGVVRRAIRPEGAL
jgi:hypothetical protein